MKLNIIQDDVERKRFIRFAIVGAIGAVVDFSTYNGVLFFPLGFIENIFQAGIDVKSEAALTYR